MRKFVSKKNHTDLSCCILYDKLYDIVINILCDLFLSNIFKSIVVH